MLDRKYLRENTEEAKGHMARRGEEFPALVDEFVKLDEERRGIQQHLDENKAQKNAASKQIGQFMKEGKRNEAEAEKQRISELGQEIDDLEAKFKQLTITTDDLLLSMPNIPHPGIPVGGEENSEVLFETGELKAFNFEPKNHLELCESLQLVNFEAGARISGSGFPVFHGMGAVLQRALINLMLDMHWKNGYTELRPPFIVHPRSPLGTGQLPKFGDEMYHVSVQCQDKPDDIPEGLPHFFLIPTAEVPVCNYYRDQVLESPNFPIKLCAYSPCWRVEGGSYGKEARGLTRLHQFEKVELVRVSDPEKSWDDLEEITAEAEGVLAALGLAYRRIVLPTGDMAFGSAKTYDVEVYCPAERSWREISSASNTTDYQSRRANVRFRREQGGKPEFVHMLNASGLALPRLVIAVLETYQTDAGAVQVPEVLHPYMGGVKLIEPPKDGVPFV